MRKRHEIENILTILGVRSWELSDAVSAVEKILGVELDLFEAGDTVTITRGEDDGSGVRFSYTGKLFEADGKLAVMMPFGEDELPLDEYFSYPDSPYTITREEN